jgi:hypothetical protein
MSEADRAFLATVVQIIPVLLLALVIEARLFTFKHADAIAGVKEAREGIRQTMHPVIYWLWRFRTGYRRNGVSTLINVVLAGGLAVSEFIGLAYLAYPSPLGPGARSALVLAVSAGLIAVALKPVFEQIVRQNVQLVELEREVAASAKHQREKDRTKRDKSRKRLERD